MPTPWSAAGARDGVGREHVVAHRLAHLRPPASAPACRRRRGRPRPARQRDSACRSLPGRRSRRAPARSRGRGKSRAQLGVGRGQRSSSHLDAAPRDARRAARTGGRVRRRSNRRRRSRAPRVRRASRGSPSSRASPGSRPSRSSIATSLSSPGSERPSSMSSRRGTMRNGRPGAFARLDHALQQRGVHRRHCDDEQAAPRFRARCPPRSSRCAQHRHALHLAATQLGGIVEEADRVRRPPCVAGRARALRPRGPRRGSARARGAVVARERMFLPRAIQQARRAEQADQRERIQDQHRARHVVQAVVEEQAEARWRSRRAGRPWPG